MTDQTAVGQDEQNYDIGRDSRLEARVGAALLERGWTVSAAESCTGGLVLHRLTNIPGCSTYIRGGVVSYSNEVKMALLGVREATLIAHGAVSAETAREMAEGALARFDADVAVSVTGIAGPGGGSAEKPVGLVYIGLALPGQPTQARRYQWHGDREANKAASADAALEWLLDALQGREG